MEKSQITISSGETQEVKIDTESVVNIVETILRPLATHKLLENKNQLNNKGAVRVVKYDDGLRCILSIKVPFLRKHGAVWESPETTEISVMPLETYLGFNPDAGLVQKVLTGVPIVLLEEALVKQKENE